MKRKANLFYTSGPDSKFITFSNYTECLTGNFLSLETKLFPDKFLCLKINNLNSETKPMFIKFLSMYYENKLAMLRDHNIEANVNIESNILPLSYLLEAIMLICNTNDVEAEWSIDIDRLNNAVATKCLTEDSEDILENRPLNSLITYIGEITEQDYNGTYTDTICYIDLSAYNEGEIIMKQAASSENYSSVSTDETDHLYGWENDFILEGYEDAKPIYDEFIDNHGTYTYSSRLSRIKLNEISNTKNTESLGKTLRFNVIIPLFNLLNKNISHDNWSTYGTDDTQYKYIDLEKTSETEGLRYIYDVPLGLWIHAEEPEDSFIELKNDNSLNLYPSWSLLISSQFKPFPYSNQEVMNNASSGALSTAHSTYAEVLTKMNSVLDSFINLSNRVTELDAKVTALEHKTGLNADGTISDINEYLTSTETRIMNELKDMREKFYGYVNNVTWTGVG